MVAVVAVAALPPTLQLEHVPDKLVITPDDGVPSAGVVKDGDTLMTNVLPVPVCDPVDVALPVLVITPVRFALVVTVPASVALAAFPPIEQDAHVPFKLVITPELGVPNAEEINVNTFPVVMVAASVAELFARK